MGRRRSGGVVIVVVGACLASPAGALVRRVPGRSGRTARRWTTTKGLRVRLAAEDDGPRPLAESTYRGVLSFEGGAIPSASEVRALFDRRFASPRDSSASGGPKGSQAAARFVWDKWHVTHAREDWPASARRDGAAGVQYNLLRCPAADYLRGEEEEDLFDSICAELCAFGRTRLGCDAFTPPWLALYVDGDEMEWHTDPNHGPLAFVLNLTPDGYHGREGSDDAPPGYFSGGETVLLAPAILDYWRGLDPTRRGLERDGILQTYTPAPFGRLLCFDGRVPHKVSRVQGTRDPRRGRLVLTGWFSNPRPTADGALAAEDHALAPGAQAALDAALKVAFDAFDACSLGRAVGFLALRLEINASGSVDRVDALADTLKADPASFVAAPPPEDDDDDDDDDHDHDDDDDDGGGIMMDDPAADDDDDDEDADAAVLADFADASTDVAIRQLLAAALTEATFPRADAGTIITVPLAFE